MGKNLCFLSVLISCLWTAAAGEPICDGVPDFGGCRGNTAGFCHKDIACSCKDGHAFCSCPYYKGPHADYWYMGAKCDQLWSTWDMIAVTVLPAVALAFVVAVTAQLIHFCKTSPKSQSKKKTKEDSERQTSHTHHNRAFMSEEPSRNLRYPDALRVNVSAPTPQKFQESPWRAPPPQPHSPPRKMSYYLDEAPDRRIQMNEEPKPPVSQGYGRRYPEQDYDSRDRQAPQQLARSGVPVLPQADYGWGSSETNNRNADWSGRSFSFGRPQVKNGYEY